MIEKIYLLSISGGKDSTAMWLYLRNDLKLPNLIPIFCDTGWEHPLTYAYLDYLEQNLGPLIRLKPDLDFVELAKKKKRFPSTKARFCTEYLKMAPAKAWIESETKAGRLDRNAIIQCSGVRAEESRARAAMAEMVEVDDYFKLPQWRPIIAWTWQEVFAIHDRYGIDANPLYKLGMGRVGCMPCIMANLSEIGEIARRFPEVLDKVKAAEATVRTGDGQPSSFFSPDTIPERFRSRTSVSHKTGKTTQIGTAEDVFEYAKLEKPERLYGGKMTPLFEEPPNEDVGGSCSSIYGLCE